MLGTGSSSSSLESSITSAPRLIAVAVAGAGGAALGLALVEALAVFPLLLRETETTGKGTRFGFSLRSSWLSIWV